ncbi:hypothetical protein BDM02DRAFT_3122990 [Thelephora ganbajun]|uniref:Uncharacterized protein n=1 Tax=Thelephora ganbajun TaxID=370292 RepID=A0ACB6Z2L4_THEGA|nr:hypothetical protein BDM02DRAFT_3122990 [Thelephora ganbajun]
MDSPAIAGSTWLNTTRTILPPTLASLTLSSLLLMSHPVFGINELLRLVIDELIEDSLSTALSFAVACRSFEEPTLSSLWEHQDSLIVLLEVLPNHTLVQDEDGVETIVIEHDPSAEDWARLQRYASWMRKIHLGLDGEIPRRPLFLLSRNCPGGVLFPKLEWLLWEIDETYIALTFFRLFLSPHLKTVTFYSHYNALDIPQDRLDILVQIILSFPASLEDLTLTCGQGDEEPLKDAITSFICRGGASLRRFSSRIPLSEVAVHHLMQLPNLHSWVIVQEPPRTVPTSIFPSLKDLRIDKPVALPWLHLLASHGKGILRNGSASAISHTNVRETLTSIVCPCSVTINSTLLSSVISFRNLVVLSMITCCSDAGSCNFHLTDDDMENLAVTLPRLVTLRFGLACRFNSCNTTVASLLMISVHCLDLVTLETHFNTRTIVGDIQRLLDGGSGRDKAKCKLWNLAVGYLPFEVYGEDIETVATGFKFIFPCLMDFFDSSGCWSELRRGMRERRRHVRR